MAPIRCCWISTMRTGQSHDLSCGSPGRDQGEAFVLVQRALNGDSLIIADLKARTGRERCSTGGSTEHEDVLSHGVWCFCRHETACAVAGPSGLFHGPGVPQHGTTG